MDIGIIGTGRMAYARAKCVSLLPDVRLIWVCSRSREQARRFIDSLDKSSRGTEPGIYDNLNTALNERKADGVFITSPNTKHFIHAQEVLSAGVSVFLEYPPTVTPADGDTLLSLAKHNSVSYMIGLSHLYNGKHNAIAALCREEADVSIGKPIAYQHIICTGNPISRWYGDENLSGGMFVSSMYHYIDSVIDFFGDPLQVDAAYHAIRDTNGNIVSDNAGIQMSFTAGCTAQISYARGMTKPGIGSRRLIIFERGYLIEDDTGTRILTPDETYPLEFENRNALLEESAIFIDAVRSRGVIDKTVDHAQRSLRIAWKVRKQIIK